MKRRYILAAVFILSVILSGCASKQEPPHLTQPETEAATLNERETALMPEEKDTILSETIPEIRELAAATSLVTTLRPDWSPYFGELNGAAVILDPEDHTFKIYNEDLADTRRSPCSTFKIISSLAGLESRVIIPEDSFRTWSGETFWNDDWNRDIDFPSAFRTSCVWYYRQVIDDIGPEFMQDTLETLQYGNCDLSDWEGHRNNNNSNPALTGFWIESSLKISPREQTKVLERIFGRSSQYSSDIRSALEEVMFLQESSDDTCKVYGKTGMGKSSGIVVDCWYTGFADIGHRIYFCVYLGKTANQNVSSTKAREIAVSLIKDNYGCGNRIMP